VPPRGDSLHEGAVRGQDRGGHEAPPRPWQPVHLARLPRRTQDPRHRVESILRPPAEGQRMRRAIHPDPEGAAALAAPIPDHRGAQLGAPRLRPPLHQTVDHRADRLPNARSVPTHPPRGGRVNTNFNLSQKLDAVHFVKARAPTPSSSQVPFLLRPETQRQGLACHAT